MPGTRAVLDTNAWLDWLVFDDASMQPLRRALARDELEIVVDANCEQELILVLAYPALALDATAQARSLAQLRAHARRVDPAPAAGAPLPRCRDADDQKFLELACRARAGWLITRDKALLRLDRHRLKPPGLRIATAGAFAAACAALPA